MNRYQRKVILTARTLAFAMPLAHLLLLVTLLVARPKSALITFPPLIGFNAAGTTELKSDGSLQLSSAGAVRVASGSSNSCCCSCWACSSCTDTPPGSYIFSLSGTSPCHTTCSRCNAASNSVAYINTDSGFDGTWTIPCNAVACQWALTDNSVLKTFDEYTGGGAGDPTCAGAATHLSLGFGASVSKTTSGGGTKQIQVMANWGLGNIFDSGVVNQNSCNDPAGYTFGNVTTCPGCSGSASGGTGTLTPA